MKKVLFLIGNAILIAMLAAAAAAQGNSSTSPGNQSMAKAVVPTDDAGIQKCISDRFASSPSLKTQGFNVTVSGGVATLAGNAKNAGSKGSATMVAKRCGAKSVVNNIAVAPADDAAIQKCITDKFASSPSLKSQSLSASVSGGVATLTGNAKDAGSKGAATNVALRCGAQHVTNDITVPASSKPPTKKPGT